MASGRGNGAVAEGSPQWRTEDWGGWRWESVPCNWLTRLAGQWTGGQWSWVGQPDTEAGWRANSSHAAVLEPQAWTSVQEARSQPAVASYYAALGLPAVPEPDNGLESNPASADQPAVAGSTPVLQANDSVEGLACAQGLRMEPPPSIAPRLDIQPIGDVTSWPSWSAVADPQEPAGSSAAANPPGLPAVAGPSGSSAVADPQGPSGSPAVAGPQEDAGWSAAAGPSRSSEAALPICASIVAYQKRDYAYFQRRREYVVTQTKCHHNWALKNFRQSWHDSGLQGDASLDVEERDYTLKAVEHPWAGHASAVADPHVGAAFIFHPLLEFRWHWHDLIAWLRDDDIAYMCNDDDGRPAGHELIGCLLSPETGSLDIGNVRRDGAQAKLEGRSHEYSNRNRPVVLNFVIQRSDGTIFSLHPSHNGNKIPCKRSAVADPAPPAVPTPDGGVYGTDGPGTFRRIKNWNKTADLRFDQQAVRLAQQRAHPRGQLMLLRSDGLIQS